MGPNTANSQYLDVYMEGTVDGWMGIGFSLDQAMVSAIRTKYYMIAYNTNNVYIKNPLLMYRVWMMCWAVKWRIMLSLYWMVGILMDTC